mmetsp:Transcript_5970/g.9928  ORF Transcript_5970/g.9928 Transcript_5970/m.9928 type:complete len:632 (-) Transcript_5970:154-2049(-)
MSYFDWLRKLSAFSSAFLIGPLPRPAAGPPVLEHLLQHPPRLLAHLVLHAQVLLVVLVQQVEPAQVPVPRVRRVGRGHARAEGQADRLQQRVVHHAVVLLDGPDVRGQVGVGAHVLGVEGVLVLLVYRDLVGAEADVPRVEGAHVEVGLLGGARRQARDHLLDRDVDAGEGLGAEELGGHPQCPHARHQLGDAVQALPRQELLQRVLPHLRARVHAQRLLQKACLGGQLVEELGPLGQLERHALHQRAHVLRALQLPLLPALGQPHVLQHRLHELDVGLQLRAALLPLGHRGLEQQPGGQVVGPVLARPLLRLHVAHHGGQPLFRSHHQQAEGGHEGVLLEDERPAHVVVVPGLVLVELLLRPQLQARQHLAGLDAEQVLVVHHEGRERLRAPLDRVIQVDDEVLVGAGDGQARGAPHGPAGALREAAAELLLRVRRQRGHVLPRVKVAELAVLLLLDGHAEHLDSHGLEFGGVLVAELSRDLWALLEPRFGPLFQVALQCHFLLRCVRAFPSSCVRRRPRCVRRHNLHQVPKILRLLPSGLGGRSRRFLGKLHGGRGGGGWSSCGLLLRWLQCGIDGRAWGRHVLSSRLWRRSSFVLAFGRPSPAWTLFFRHHHQAALPIIGGGRLLNKS